MSASVAAENTAEGKKSRARGMIGPRLKGFMLALVVPLLLLLGWHLAVKAGMTRLIPSPAEVAEYMVDFAVGGIWDDAFSATLHIHLFASMTRVYGGFA
ncbi:MAG: ABC transporter permease, partial [Alphaproteobacteria bacterium]